MNNRELEKENIPQLDVEAAAVILDSILEECGLIIERTAHEVLQNPSSIS